MTQIQYGSSERTHVIDEHGSTLTSLKKFRSGIVAGPVSNRLKLRHPTDALSIEDLGKMVHDLLTDPTKLQPTIELDRSVKDGKTHYYIIESYTIIE